jgi:dolichyl-phosphate-mannose--protein O-mannosyl transferase
MSLPPSRPDDPFAWHLVIALGFFGLGLVRLGIPSAPYFDEVHYVPAIRSFIELNITINEEHPPLAKQIMALGVWLLGDNPYGWRIMSLLAGTLALLAAMRAMWLTGRARAASLLTGVFVASNFLLFVHARIAMLDVFMVSFVMLALWMLAGALRQNETARLRLAIAGVALGAAMAAKWNAVPLAMLPGLAFLVLRVRAAGWQFMTSTRAAPVRGMALWEAAVWLGAVPLAVYALTFWPYSWFIEVRAPTAQLIGFHQYMLELQTQLHPPHPYQSSWWQWVLNLRPIWYLYETADGAQRGIMLIGNPLTMLAGLPALAWCAWAGVRGRRADCLAVSILYLASLALWVVAPKPVQFYFHYFLPAMFLSAALALATQQLWQRGNRLVPVALVAGALALFGWWYPVLSAAPLSGDQPYLRWAWFQSWR